MKEGEAGFYRWSGAWQTYFSNSTVAEDWRQLDAWPGFKEERRHKLEEECKVQRVQGLIGTAKIQFRRVQQGFNIRG